MKIQLATLYYNTTTEEGEVRIDWKAMPTGVVGLDVLSDWLADIEQIYSNKIDEVFNSSTEEKK